MLENRPQSKHKAEIGALKCEGSLHMNDTLTYLKFLLRGGVWVVEIVNGFHISLNQFDGKT